MAVPTTLPDTPSGAVTRSARAVAAPAPRGRRKSDRSSLPDWLPAPLLASEDPRDGDLADPGTAEVGDYILEFHQGTGTASWLRVHAVAVVEGATLITCGRAPGVTLSYPAGRQQWLLRRADAARVAYASVDKVLHAWRGPEREMEALLRSYATRAALLAAWPDAGTLADAVAVWEMLRVSDLANQTDASRVAVAAVPR